MGFYSEPITGNSEDPSSRYEITGDGRLTIHNTQHSDEGVYSCMAINIAGETRMAHAKLWYISNVGTCTGELRECEV